MSKEDFLFWQHLSTQHINPVQYPEQHHRCMSDRHFSQPKRSNVWIWISEFFNESNCYLVTHFAEPGMGSTLPVLSVNENGWRDGFKERALSSRKDEVWRVQWTDAAESPGETCPICHEVVYQVKLRDVDRNCLRSVFVDQDCRIYINGYLSRWCFLRTTNKTPQILLADPDLTPSWSSSTCLDNKNGK